MMTATPRYQRRRIINRIAWLACLAATALCLVALGAILFQLLYSGLPKLSLDVFTTRTRASGGGLGNAIIGSLTMTALGTLLGTVVGMAAGSWLAASRSRWAGVIRFASDMLLSAPSIIIGLFIYALVVLPSGGFSGWAGSIALAIIVLPMVIRSTEDMLRLVPAQTREAAYALGAPRWKVLTSISYRMVMPGIVTGILLGCARISGETAPLIFTSLNTNQWNWFHLSDAMPNLPMTLYQNMTLTGYDANKVALAWTGALLMTLMILVLGIVSRRMARTS